MDRIFEEENFPRRVYDGGLKNAIKFIDSMITPDTTLKQCAECHFKLNVSWFDEESSVCKFCIEDAKAKEENGN